MPRDRYSTEPPNLFFQDQQTPARFAPKSRRGSLLSLSPGEAVVVPCVGNWVGGAYSEAARYLTFLLAIPMSARSCDGGGGPGRPRGPSTHGWM